YHTGRNLFILILFSVLCLSAILSWHSSAQSANDIKPVIPVIRATTDAEKRVTISGQGYADANFEAGAVIVKFKQLVIAEDAVKGNKTERGTVKMLTSPILTEILGRYGLDGATH